MNSDDSYSDELLAKWASDLVNVLEQNKIHVAQRLEAAYRRSLGPNADREAVQKEMNSLQREGYFRTQSMQDERKDIHVRKVRQKR